MKHEWEITPLGRSLAAMEVEGLCKRCGKYFRSQHYTTVSEIISQDITECAPDYSSYEGHKWDLFNGKWDNTPPPKFVCIVCGRHAWKLGTGGVGKCTPPNKLKELLEASI